jgi:hypothetical protein
MILLCYIVKNHTASQITKFLSVFCVEVSMTPQEFPKNDKQYLDWIHSHPRAFVINMERGKNPRYMVLHQAWCKTMNQLVKGAAPGGFTERQYIKVCADDLSSLRNWVRQHGRPDGSFTNEHECYR